MPTSFGGNASNNVACAVLSSAPPPMPCTTRQKTSPPSDVAAPQKNDDRTNRMIEPVRYRFRPKYAESHPDIGMTMTLAMMYPVDTHEISSSVAPRFPIMCGMATLTIDVSTSSSTAANVTAIAMRYLYLYLSSATATAALGASSWAPEDMVVDCAIWYCHESFWSSA